jgi:hypothetical protein
MMDKSNTDDALPDNFEKWIQSAPVRCSDDFYTRLQTRLHASTDPLDELIDDLLSMRTNLKSPQMEGKILAKLASPEPSKTVPIWFSILRPLAAAAVLTVAFWGFQQNPRERATPQLTVQLSTEEVSAAEMELIFALASTLEHPSDWHELKGPDNWAFLID